MGVSVPRVDWSGGVVVVITAELSTNGGGSVIRGLGLRGGVAAVRATERPGAAARHHVRGHDVPGHRRNRPRRYASAADTT